MNRCIQCNLDILDNTQVCPLCGSVVKNLSESENAYPDIRYSTRFLSLLVRIYLFLAIVLEALLIFINITSQSEILWSGITGLGLLYGYVLLRFAFLGQNGYRFKTILSVLIGLSILIAADYLSGYRGWAVTYAVPIAIIVIDCCICLLMIINHRNWQSYLSLQIFMIFCSLIMILLLLPGIVRKPQLAVVSFAASVTLFLGTFIIGDRKARIELKRRFHV